MRRNAKIGAKSQCYRVDYHVILASYFSCDHQIPGPLLSKLWRSLRELGGLDTEVTLRRKGVLESWEERTQLGAVSIKTRLDQTANDLSLFAASAARPDAQNAILDSDVNLSYTPDDIWNGEPTAGLLDLSISGQLAERAGESTLEKILRTAFNIADECHSHYGLIDIASPDDAYAGTVFGCTWPATAPLHRWVEQHNWASSGALKGDRARGIYWGNYFGNAILNRLGGREEFMNGYREPARNFDGTPNSLIWEFPNGLFISLCESPIDMEPGGALPAAADENFRWLCRELGTKGVLNPW
jgi:hypothetical protein